MSYIFIVGILVRRQATCRCSLGTPSSVAEQPGEYQRQAAMMQRMWQHQNQMFPREQQPPVDIALPRLLRQTIPELEPLPPPGAVLRPTTSFCHLKHCAACVDVIKALENLLQGPWTGNRQKWRCGKLARTQSQHWRRLLGWRRLQAWTSTSLKGSRWT